MKKILLIGTGCIALMAAVATGTFFFFPSQSEPTPEVSSFSFTKMDHDPHGVWQRNGSQFSSIDGERVSVYASEDSPIFAVVYLPSETPERNLVLLPGTTGIAYAGIFDEMTAAEEMNTAIISIQWYDFETKTYADAATIHAAINELFTILDTKIAEKSILRGFSRGGAMSFEIAALDAAGAQRFTGIASESGGVPKDGNVESKSQPKDAYEATYQFFSSLNNGSAKPTTFANQHFLLYCGLKDEEWGAEMCDMMDRANTLVPKYGGTVDVFIRDENGKHMDLIRNKTHYQIYLDWMEEMTK